jgi:DNA-binding Xre family transcriptional regulator/molecular chaperone GrpE (heat shock protein)
MQAVGLSSFKELGQKAGVSDRQIKRLRQGKAMEMQAVTLLRLSQALHLSLVDLLRQFSDSPDTVLGQAMEASEASAKPSLAGSDLLPSQDQELVMLRQEYDRLQLQLAEQRQALWQDFQQSCLQILEPWMLQFPTAAYAAQNNPQAPAVKLLPLMRPVEHLLQNWGVTPIAPVGAEIPFDPHYHQLMEGQAAPGDRVKVRYVGYLHADNLIHRAKVSPTTSVGGVAS